MRPHVTVCAVQAVMRRFFDPTPWGLSSATLRHKLSTHRRERERERERTPLTRCKSHGGR
jgi:hypothetical protein